MKNPIALLKSNPVVTKAIGAASKIYLDHESLILTSGTIGFGMAATAVAMKNAVKINETLQFAREALAECNTKEERNDVYKLFIGEMAPLVAPIVIFEAAMIGCSILSKKKLDLKDKKIAELAGALSIAQTAVTQYQAFAKEAETALGDKKYDKLQSDISENLTVDGRRFTSIASEGAPGEVLMIDKYSGRPFWSTTERVKYAANELARRLSPEGGYDIQTVDDWYDLIGNKDLMTEGETGVLARKFGYVSGVFRADDICTRFSDSHYRFPNGTVIPAFIVRLSPEPACVDTEAD
jgi:hypothetical protein